MLLAAVIMFFLDAPWDSVSTFKISRPRDNWAVGNLVLPSQLFNLIAAIILAFLGTRLFLRGGGRWTGLSLGIGLVILAMAFLVWATAGKSISLTGMLQATVVRAVPIALAALGGILCERVAVINIAIEGMLLAGAFAGAFAAGAFAGTFACFAAGAAFGAALFGPPLLPRFFAGAMPAGSMGGGASLDPAHGGAGGCSAACGCSAANGSTRACDHSTGLACGCGAPGQRRLCRSRRRWRRRAAPRPSQPGAVARGGRSGCRGQACLCCRLRPEFCSHFFGQPLR